MEKLTTLKKAYSLVADKIKVNQKKRRTVISERKKAEAEYDNKVASIKKRRGSLVKERQALDLDLINKWQSIQNEKKKLRSKKADTKSNGRKYQKRISA